MRKKYLYKYIWIVFIFIWSFLAFCGHLTSDERAGKRFVIHPFHSCLWCLPKHCYVKTMCYDFREPILSQRFSQQWQTILLAHKTFSSSTVQSRFGRRGKSTWKLFENLAFDRVNTLLSFWDSTQSHNNMNQMWCNLWSFPFFVFPAWIWSRVALAKGKKEKHGKQWKRV